MFEIIQDKLGQLAMWMARMSEMELNFQLIIYAKFALPHQSNVVLI